MKFLPILLAVAATASAITIQIEIKEERGQGKICNGYFKECSMDDDCCSGWCHQEKDYAYCDKYGKGSLMSHKKLLGKGRFRTTCQSLLEPCGDDDDCCSDKCHDDTCIAPEEPGCEPLFQSCSDDKDCCSESCTHELCVPKEEPGCKELFQGCEKNGDCCSESCFDDICVSSELK